MQYAHLYTVVKLLRGRQAGHLTLALSGAAHMPAQRGARILFVRAWRARTYSRARPLQRGVRWHHSWYLLMSSAP
jgi:hypothetical protein